jgi:serine/threonine protein kinase
MNIINNKYKILNKIGSGSFGSIFQGENIRTGENVAIKVEAIGNQLKMLKNESIIYHYLTHVKGIPIVKWFGKDQDNYYMVINLLGDSLQKKKETCGIFSLQTTIKIGIQIVHLLKTIHDKGLIHRDIKPDNFLLGLNENTKQVYMIDFGFCKKYMDNHKHIPMKQTSNIIGSLTYTSIHSHHLNELSRRDDLESLGYLLLYLCTNCLEWQTIGSSMNFEEKNNYIRMKKEDLLQAENRKLPEVFIHYLQYVRNLAFEELPNYSYIVDLFAATIISIDGQ